MSLSGKTPALPQLRPLPISLACFSTSPKPSPSCFYLVLSSLLLFLHPPFPLFLSLCLLNIPPRWINRQWSMHTVEYYSVLQRDSPSSPACRNLKNILLRQRSQSEKATVCVVPATRHPRKGITTETVKRSAVARDFRAGKEA